ncbi:MAG TPA: Na/Pi cotransporter family protein, partial [Candidatus Limnocylindria bacterium]|nr:Na/Pi cotransporter family protein [Candidatus Limnocylindria bacterium]
VVLILAAAFTALVHSSAATIGIALSLAQAGLIPLAGAVPIILGANVGTAATAFLASVGANPEARRVAAAHGGFKIVGALLFLPFLPQFGSLVATTAPDVPRQIANAHTIFNVFLALLFIPFIDPAARALHRLLPDTARSELGAIYLDARTLDTPAVALGQALREVLRMGDVVVSSLRDTLRVFERNDGELLRQIVTRDDQIDRLEEDIKQFLIRLGRENLTVEQSDRETALLFVIVNLEEIGDVIEKDLLELAEKKIRGQHRFSEQGWAEIRDLHAMVLENVELAISALATGDRTIAEKVIRHKGVVNALERQLRQTHMSRLHDGLRESIDTSSIHLDVLGALKRVNSLAAGVGYAVLGQHLATTKQGA